MVAPQPPVIPSGALSNKDCHNVTESETMFSSRCKYLMFYFFLLITKLWLMLLIAHMHDMSYNFDEESSLDVSSPRCLNSPSVSIYKSGKLLFLLLKIPKFC